MLKNYLFPLILIMDEPFRLRQKSPVDSVDGLSRAIQFLNTPGGGRVGGQRRARGQRKALVVLKKSKFLSGFIKGSFKENEVMPGKPVDHSHICITL